MLALLLFLGFVGFLVAAPLILAAFVIRLALGLAMIPLRLAAFAVRMSLGLALGLVALILGGTLIVLPLLPFILLAVIVWMIVRFARRSPRAQVLSS
jgi:hypothetical protein